MFRLTNEEKSFLLRLARGSLKAAVCGGAVETPGKLPAMLENPGGAFVSLHENARLRGCVGYPFPLKPLYKTVMEAAVDAALNDPRFPRVRAGELAGLEVEISVLSPCREVRPEEIRVGVHGVIVSQGFSRGLLLPQVAVERRWTPLRFLEETCRKAGLPPGAWQRDARIEIFTAEIFNEHALAVEELRT